MDHNGPPNDFFYAKTIGFHNHEYIAMVSNERKQIARVHGMLTIIRIEMSAGIRKRICIGSRAGRTLVNMKTEESWTA